MIEFGKLYRFEVINDTTFVPLYEKYDDVSWRSKLTKSCFCIVVNEAYDLLRGIKMFQILFPKGIFWVTKTKAKLSPIYVID